MLEILKNFFKKILIDNLDNKLNWFRFEKNYRTNYEFSRLRFKKIHEKVENENKDRHFKNLFKYI